MIKKTILIFLLSTFLTVQVFAQWSKEERERIGRLSREDHQFVFRGILENSQVLLDRVLLVAVEEVDFDTFDAPRLEQLEFEPTHGRISHAAPRQGK